MSISHELRSRLAQSRAGLGAADALRKASKATESFADRLAPGGAAPAPASDPGDRPGAEASTYATHWEPGDIDEAIRQIYNTESLSDFEEGGRQDAKQLATHFDAASTVLDLGCGAGRIALYVAEQCSTLWAVDVSPAMLRLASARLAHRSNVRYAQCLETRFPDVPDGSVDFAYSILVLQHVEREDAYRLLRELLRILRPGGSAYLTFPNFLSDEYLNSFLHYVEQGEVANPARARFYTPQELERLLPAAGFELVDLRPGIEIAVTVRKPEAEPDSGAAEPTA